MRRSREVGFDVMCSECGEPWSAHASNHQPGCDAKNRVALRVPRVREVVVRELVAVAPANGPLHALALRFAGGRR